jgi:hypothetical protein
LDWKESRKSPYICIGYKLKNEIKGNYSRSSRRWLLAEVPAIEGCMTQGDTFDELLQNIYEAVEGCLSLDVESEY